MARALQAAFLAEGLCEVYAGRRESGIALLHTAVQEARVLKFPLTDTLLSVVTAFEHNLRAVEVAVVSTTALAHFALLELDDEVRIGEASLVGPRRRVAAR